jgi:hypothetical protein
MYAQSNPSVICQKSETSAPSASFTLPFIQFTRQFQFSIPCNSLYGFASGLGYALTIVKRRTGAYFHRWPLWKAGSV